MGSRSSRTSSSTTAARVPSTASSKSQATTSKSLGSPLLPTNSNSKSSPGIVVSVDLSSSSSLDIIGNNSSTAAAAMVVGGSAPDLISILAIKRALNTDDDKTRILMVGLTGAGKSTLLTRICGGTREIHDMGNQKFKVRTLSTIGLHFTMWDVGEDKFVDPYWLRLYSERVSVVCFVADSTTNLDVARRELFNLVALEQFKDKPLCIIATKGNVHGALSVVKFSEQMELHEMPVHRKYKVFQSGGPSDALQVALDWMVRWDLKDGTFYNGPGKELSNTSSVSMTQESPQVASPVIMDHMQGLEDPPTPEEIRVMRKTPSRGSFVVNRAVEKSSNKTTSEMVIMERQLAASIGGPRPSDLGMKLPPIDPSSAASSDGYLVLPRGGYLVTTKTIGSIQFGIPPETIKDSLMRGLTVPENFVILGEMFDRKLGLSQAEFEFPIYYRYFIFKSKVNIITTALLEERIRRALKETLIGPGTDCHVEEDYPVGTSPDALPNFEAEAACLDPSRIKTTLDDVVRFTRFDPQQGATLGNVKIRPIHDPKQIKSGQRLRYEVCEDDHVIAQVPSHFKLHAAPLNIYGIGGGGAVATGTVGSMDASDRAQREKYLETEKRHMTGMDVNSGNSASLVPLSLGGNGGTGTSNSHLGRVESVNFDAGGDDATAIFEHYDDIFAQQLPTYNLFDIPVFGVTMMGASHGFDASGRTTGFVLWMNRRGIMVDPPPDSSRILENMGVPPLAIEAVFLTHTHADHDAGTFQKILRTKLIRLYATRTVEKSFVRKYSAITGFEEKFLRSMFDFHAVKCNEPLKIYDGHLRFFYTLHTIPCVGFEAYFNKHSIVYSADTRYDPDMVMRLAEEGKIGKQRAHELANFNFDHTVVLHELGVPPIHTPRAALEKAAQNPKYFRNGEPLQKRLFIVHAGRNEGAGLGFQCHDWDTIRIFAAQDNKNQTREIVSLLSNVAWLAGVGEDKLEKLAAKCFVRKFEPGDLVTEFPEAVPPDRLYFVMAGMAREELEEGEERQNLFPIGCSFGEIGLLRQLDKLTTPSKAIPGAKLGKPPPGRKTLASRNLKDFPHRKFYAESILYVLEVRNKDLLSVFQKSVLVGEVRDKLRRFNGYPEDARWRAISRNLPLMYLLEGQLAVRDFLVSMTEELLTLPQGHVFQDGRSNAPPDSAFVINEGCVRVTLMTGAFSFRGTDASPIAAEPYELGRGAVVGDFNALIKHSKSTFRITALTECEVFLIPRDALIEFLNDYPGARILFLDRVHYGWVLPSTVGQSGKKKDLDLFGGMVVNSGGDKPF